MLFVCGLCSQNTGVRLYSLRSIYFVIQNSSEEPSDAALYLYSSALMRSMSWLRSRIYRNSIRTISTHYRFAFNS